MERAHVSVPGTRFPERWIFRYSGVGQGNSVQVKFRQMVLWARFRRSAGTWFRVRFQGHGKVRMTPASRWPCWESAGHTQKNHVSQFLSSRRPVLTHDRTHAASSSDWSCNALVFVPSAGTERIRQNAGSGTGHRSFAESRSMSRSAAAAVKNIFGGTAYRDTERPGRSSFGTEAGNGGASHALPPLYAMSDRIWWSVLSTAASAHALTRVQYNFVVGPCSSVPGSAENLSFDDRVCHYYGDRGEKRRGERTDGGSHY